jgi:hypothetical protein
MNLLDSISNFPRWAIAAHLMRIDESSDIVSALAIADMVLFSHREDTPSLSSLFHLYQEAENLLFGTAVRWKRIYAK